MTPKTNPREFAVFCALAVDDADLLAEYDRLRGTSLSLRGSALEVAIDKATGRLEADAKGFAEFLEDVFERCT